MTLLITDFTYKHLTVHKKYVCNVAFIIVISKVVIGIVMCPLSISVTNH